MDVNLTTLDNGLRIITVERLQTETVSVGIWTNTGSAYETDKINGISHFIEHMVFKGTKKRTALQISEDIENVGGQTNAYTSRDYTVYYAKMLKDDLELAVDVLADFIMAPTFPIEELSKEQEVVIQEIKQSNDDPSDIVFDYFQNCAYANQALGRSILGPEENVHSFNGDMLRDYMCHNYAASNMIVAAVGNLQHDKFVQMVKERMVNLRSETDFTPDKQIYIGGEFIKQRDTEQAQVLLGFEGINKKSDDYYALSVLSTILGGSMSSRLFQEIREKRGLVYSVYSFANHYDNSGLFGIYAGLNEQEIKQYIPVVADEIKKISNEYVTDAEIKRVKVQLKAGLMMALESSSATAESITRQMMTFNRIIPIEETLERLNNVTKQDVMNMAQKVFSSKLTYTMLGNLKNYPSYDDVVKMLKGN